MERLNFIQKIPIKKILIVIALIISILVTCTILLSLLILIKSKPYIYSDIFQIPNSQVGVIPGAAILRSGKISPVYRDRVDTAIALYNAGKIEKILVSGDNSSVDYNEVNPAQTYLLENDIPIEDIFLDHAGFDTYSSMYRARDIFLTESIVIVSQSFHLPRSIFIAQNLNINAIGMNADNGNYKWQNYIREMLANNKALLNLIFQRKPKYLGEEIPITGDRNI
jgi:SanA protein